MSNKLLVVGARPGSLGSRVARAAKNLGFNVETAGISSEALRLDATDTDQVHSFMKASQYDHVVCTVGLNLPGTLEGKGWIKTMDSQMRVNYFGPMIVLSEWARVWRDRIKENRNAMTTLRHFVAVSSNSANIARSHSGGYCASKAALSMGIRCAAREQVEWPFAIYAYEPGWLEGTPMSNEVEGRLRSEDIRAATHRIPGGRGINPDLLADMIVRGIAHGEKALNGCVLRIDGGEQ